MVTTAARTNMSINKGARGYLLVAGAGDKMAKTVGRERVQNARRSQCLGHPAGKYLEGKTMHVAGVHPAS